MANSIFAKSDILVICQNVFVVNLDLILVVCVPFCIPYELRAKVFFAENLCKHSTQVVYLVIVDAGQNKTVLAHQIPCQLEPRIHHVEPVGVEAAGGFGVGADLAAVTIDLAGELQVVSDIVAEVVRVDEVLAGVVGRVDVDELHLAGVGFLEELEDFEIVALDHEVARGVPIDAVLRARGRQPPQSR